MALSSSRRPNPASSPKPVEPTPAPSASTPSETGGLSDADEISKLLSALGDAEVANPPPEATPASVSLGKSSNDPVDFVIPAGPGGATRPLGAILSASEEKSVSDMDFILPDLTPDLKPDSVGTAKEPPIVKLAPSADTVRLSPASFAPRPGTGAVRLGGSRVQALGAKVQGPESKVESPGVVPAATDPAKPAKPGTVRLGGNQTEAAKTGKHGTVRLGSQGGDSPGGPGIVPAATNATKTAKHGTVRLTGNQTEAAKTGKHGTVRLTGNQTDVAKTASSAPAPATQATSATQATPAPVKDETTEPKEKKKHRRKSPKPRQRSGGQDPWASVVFVILVILVVLLYVGFFIVRPKIIAARSATQPAPAPVETAKPVARKPVAKPKPASPVKPPGKTVPSAKTQKTPIGKTSQPEDAQPPAAPAPAKAPQGGVTKPAPVTDNGLGEVDVPEDDEPVEGAVATAPVEEPAKPASKFAPPWARKDTPAQPVVEEKPKEVVIDVPAAVDVPEVREWPELKVTAVIGSGKKGSVLVNGTVVSVGEELEEGPVLKAVSRQAAVFEWDGDSRTIYVSSKNE